MSFELHEGDCLEVMPKLAPASVAMVFADLPYGSTSCAYDHKFSIDDFWPHIWRICAASSTAVFTADMRFAVRLISSATKHYRYDLVWDKVNWSTGFFKARKVPLRRHEHVLVFGKGKSVYVPQMSIGEPYTVTASPNYIAPHYNSPRDLPIRVNKGTRYPTTVLAIPAKGGTRYHPSQKPVALLEWLIATYTNPGDTVLDPCFGSGTTGVACARLGRKFIGIEKDGEYFHRGSLRIEAAYAQAKAQELA